MTKNTKNFELTLETSPSSDGLHLFCQVLVSLEKSTLGNMDAWSIAGLMAGAISDMVYRLKIQIKKDFSEFLLKIDKEELFHSLHEWQWGNGAWKYRDEPLSMELKADCFYALPIGTEIFDGENLYIIYHPDGLSRFIWQDYDKKCIYECFNDFNFYIEKWEEIQKKLENYKKEG